MRNLIRLFWFRAMSADWTQLLDFHSSKSNATYTKRHLGTKLYFLSTGVTMLYFSFYLSSATMTLFRSIGITRVEERETSHKMAFFPTKSLSWKEKVSFHPIYHWELRKYSFFIKSLLLRLDSFEKMIFFAYIPWVIYLLCSTKPFGDCLKIFFTKKGWK